LFLLPKPNVGSFEYAVKATMALMWSNNKKRRTEVF
jgi:hypothetical protein